MERLEFFADENSAGTRLDIFAASLLPLMSRSAVQKLIEDKYVLVNGKAVSKNFKLRDGDRVEILPREPQNTEIKAQDIPLDIVYEDGDLLVVNKQKGMVVHPAPGNTQGTLVNALLHHCSGELSGINGVIRPGIVHRIDKDTSGLLIVAKNDFAHNMLAAQIKEHSFKRCYLAALNGNLRDDSGTVDVPIGRSAKDRKKQAALGLNARAAVTKYEVLERYRRFCLIRCTLETGRTHQIRVHMAYLGHSVAGDTVYGGAKNSSPAGGQCLHAETLGFVHPRSGEYMEFSAVPPEYFSRFIDKVSRE